MDIIKEIDVNKPLTKDQLDMLEKASNLPISYDEDSPEFTKEELAQFKRISEFRNEDRRKQTVSIRLSPQALTKARSLGKGYTAILGRILETALEDKDLIKKCL